jgi:hypothetical protein
MLTWKPIFLVIEIEEGIEVGTGKMAEVSDCSGR